MPTITYNNIIEPDSSTGAASALKGLSIPHQLSTYVTNLNPAKCKAIYKMILCHNKLETFLLNFAPAV